MSLLLRSFLLFFTAVSGSKSLAAATIEEYYIFKVPALPLLEPAALSWFFIRSGHYWNGTDLIRFSDLEWPVWDPQQVPLSLAPPIRQQAFILIYDEAKTLIEELSLDATFAPESYFEKAQKKPAYFQVKLTTARSRVDLFSPIYNWYSKRKIAFCEIQMEENLERFLDQNSIKVCLNTIKSYLQDDVDHSKQMYFKIAWPIVKGRANISGVQSLERELKASARKKKSQIFFTKTRSKVFTAEFGLTQVENLPPIGLDLEQIKDHEVAVNAPDKTELKKNIYKADMADGSKLEVYGLYDDLVALRKIESPNFANRKIHLQIVSKEQVDHEQAAKVPKKSEQGDAEQGNKSLEKNEGLSDSKQTVKVAAEVNQVEIVETRTLQRRTGLFGLLRPWDLRVFFGWNYLSSSRGENNQIFSFPGFEASVRLKNFSFQPYVSYERGLLSTESSLVIGEVKAGATQVLPWFPSAFYQLGFHRYTLSGDNPGSTRLGGITALSLGLGAKYRVDNWFLKPAVSFLIGSSLSYDSRFDLGRFFETSTDYNVYAGAYVAYSAYRARVANQINLTELFGEDRLQFGLSIGWIGPDSF